MSFPYFHLQRASLVAASVLFASTALAQAPALFPAKPVRFVVPYAPGGNTDMIARVMGAKMAETLGQSVVVENRAGAATLIGAEFVARAAADGYTILLATSTTLGINPHIYRKLPYDPVADFAPVVLVARIPMVLTVHPSLPAKSIKEFIALAKAKPGQIPYGTAGTGSPSWMSMALFRGVTKTDLIEVPYKGSGPADIDLLAGQITAMFANTALNYIQAGRLRALAHTGEHRMRVAPEIPTMREAGLKDVVFYSWQGIVAPARTPPEAVARLNADAVRALKQPEAAARITADGAEILAGTPADFGSYIKSELARFGKVIRESGVKPE